MGKQQPKTVSRQTNIPGTNIPELEEVAEAWHKIVAAEVEMKAALKLIQEEKAEHRLALDALIESLIKADRLRRPDEGKKREIYRYLATEKNGSESWRHLCYRETKKTELDMISVSAESAANDEQEVNGE